IRDWSVTGVQTCALPISASLVTDDLRRGRQERRERRHEVDGCNLPAARGSTLRDEEQPHGPDLARQRIQHEPQRLERDGAEQRRSEERRVGKEGGTRRGW